jgi:hypothetical protein
MGRWTVTIRVPFIMFTLIAVMQDLIAKRTGKTHIINRQKLNEYREPYWLIDGSAATRDFGYQSEYCMTRGVRLTLDWYQSNGWL